MFSYDTPFTRLVAGDIFEVASAMRPNFVCLVETVSDRTLRAGNVMGGEHFDFDRRSGVAVTAEGEFAIVSIEPLPTEMYDVLMGLNRKMRLTLDRERLKLTAEEKSALLFLSGFYAKHPVRQGVEGGSQR
jgi:hypothetical protein